jgi:hypothetical protein
MRYVPAPTGGSGLLPAQVVQFRVWVPAHQSVGTAGMAWLTVLVLVWFVLALEGPAVVRVLSRKRKGVRR